jgi:hypothetical protein
MKYILNNDNLEVVGKQYLNGVGNYTGDTTNASDLATVINDKAEKSEIPTESTVSNWGFTKNQGTVIDIKANGVSLAQNNGEVNITAADLGVASAIKYCGITTTPLTDGATTNPVVIDGNNHTAAQGCVVFYEDSGNTKEFVFNGTKWELLGSDLTYKVVQNAVSSPIANGNAVSFIDTISQDANGVITATKKNINTATTEQSGIVKLVEGDMNGKDNADGQVPSLNHTHSQYANIDDVAKKSDIDAINTTIENNEKTVSVALNDINTRITTIESYDILNEVIVVKDQFDEEISKINQTIENNEETVSVALNDINTRITTIESYDILNEVIVVKDQFDEEISKINTTIENNEETVSVALNDINIRITTIENNGVTNNNLTELKSKVESLEITVKNQETKITELQTNFDLVNQKYNKLVSTLNKILGVDFNGDFNSDFAKDIIL